MKTDDPKITAYALGEMTDAERAEFECEMRAQRGAEAEVGEIRQVAGILKNTLHAEPAAGLAEHQRWAILRLADGVKREQAPVPPSEWNMVEPQWWQRVGVWQAIAACAVFTFGVYAFSVSLTRPGQKPGVAGGVGGEIVVAVPRDAAQQVVGDGMPEVLTPAEAQQRIAAAGGVSLDAAKVFPNGVVIVPPRFNLAVPGGMPERVAKAEIAREPDRLVISIPAAGPKSRDGGEYATMPGVRKPEVIGVAQHKAAASLGSADLRPPSDDAVENYLLQRMKDAERVPSGASGGDFLKVFRADGNAPGRYEMIRCATIKVDAEFVAADGGAAVDPSVAGVRLKTISKPYLQAE